MSTSATKNFWASQIFISVLAAISAVGVTVFSILYPSLGIDLKIKGAIISVALIVLAYMRWSIESDIQLINKYTSLMNLLGKLSCIESISNKKISDVINHNYPLQEPNSLFWWKEFIGQKQRDVNRKFDELNNILNKLFLIPYRLFWWENIIPLIKKDFVVLLGDTRILYNALNEMANCKNISPYDFKVDFSVIMTEYNDFILALNESQNKEIKDTIPKRMLLPFELPIPRNLNNPY